MFDTLIEKKALNMFQNVTVGSLEFETPSGDIYHFKGDQPGINADIKIEDWRVFSNLAHKGDVGFAEDFRDKFWHTSNLSSLLRFGIDNESIIDNSGNFLFRLLSKLSYLTKRNTIKGSKRNIEAHYDLGNNFYKLWLDDSMTYSSAIFKDVNESLQTAQYNKYDRILSRLNSDCGSILEIGCGWGGFAERALEKSSKYQVKGITLSQEQHQYASNRLAGKAEMVIEDYRIQQGKFDHIVSIEMFEAVGQKYWNNYFNKVKSLLNKDGKAIIQTITIDDDLFKSYAKSADMIRTYIFPGGMLPSKSALIKLADDAGLKCNNMFNFGLDYARTLTIWLDKFNANLPHIQKMGHSDKFIRMWQFYLCACIAGFTSGKTDVMQLELSHV